MAANQGELLRSSVQPPLVVDLGYGASPVTTVEFYQRLRRVRSDVEVVGLEIEPARVELGVRFLAENGHAGLYPNLSFATGGFELPTPRPPLLVRAFNVLRQYDEDEAWRAWDRLCAGLAPGGVLVEGTCDEIGRRAVWVAIASSDSDGRTKEGAPGAARPLDLSGLAEPLTITFSARVSTLYAPSELAERLPKALIHRNIPGEAICSFLRDFDRSWAMAAPQSVFGPRQRWIAAVEHLATTWPVITKPPSGGRTRWRLGEITLPWSAVAPRRA